MGLKKLLIIAEALNTCKSEQVSEQNDIASVSNSANVCTAPITGTAKLTDPQGPIWSSSGGWEPQGCATYTHVGPGGGGGQ